MGLLGIDVQTVFGMPPVAMIELAAKVGCSHISTGLSPVPWNPCHFPSWSLRDSAKLRGEFKTALADTGISLMGAEGFIVRAARDVRDLAVDMDIMQELGALRMSTVSMEPDLPRGLDQLALLAEMATDRGMDLTLEYAPPHPIGSLSAAVDAINYVDSDGIKLVLDAMHYFRSGGTLSELAQLNSDLIGYVQLCDVPKVASHDDYMQEACFERLAPGDGELPLAEFVALLPQGVAIGVEAPNIAAAESGELDVFIARAVSQAETLLSARDSLFTKAGEA